ncbi:MAG: 50S ribosomal protein L18 [Cyclobacteriaceae bacterium]|nr:50S ribosomal protein L18 [Cyclobacteriaceae bacterium]
MKITKSDRRLRIRRGIRKQITGTSERPRLSVYKSNKALYAQIIDDSKGHTLVSANSTEIGSGSTIDSSKQLGQKLAEKAKAAGIDNIVFDRGGYQYHGKVKALAEGAREGGLKF